MTSGSVSSVAVSKYGCNNNLICLHIPYLTFSQLLYDLYQSEGLPSVHDHNQLRRWIRRISAEVGVDLSFSSILMKRIYKHTSEIALSMKKMKRKGGRQMKKYLEKEWNIQLQPNFVKAQQKVSYNLMHSIAYNVNTYIQIINGSGQTLDG